MRLCAVSIDLDPISCYYRIHALGPPPRELRDRVLLRAVPRLATLLDEVGIRATFFVVGGDVDVAGNSAVLLRSLGAAGHELANHSYAHEYDMSRRGPSFIRDDMHRAHDAIAAISDTDVVGFRAPGYDVSPAMIETALTLGYKYDSSVFPAPAYYAAKALVMGVMKAVGRPSGAVMTNPRALLSPTQPYRPDLAQPWRRGDACMLELPIAVTPRARIPAIGTSMLVAPRWLRRRWVGAMVNMPLFNFELHGIDLCDASQDELPAELVRRQPDLRVPVAHKRAAFAAIIHQLRQTHRFSTLKDVAANMV